MFELYMVIVCVHSRFLMSNRYVLAFCRYWLLCVSQAAGRFSRMELEAPELIGCLSTAP